MFAAMPTQVPRFARRVSIRSWAAARSSLVAGRRRTGQEQRVVYNLSNHASPFPRRRLWRALFPVSIPPGGRAVKKIGSALALSPPFPL